MATIPQIDISPLLLPHNKESHKVAAEIGRACRELGAFYISGHGVDPSLLAEMEELSRQFFALPLETKMRIHMQKAGRAWRGYFPFGDELTGGMPDQKEGLYFGEEFEPDHPLVQANTPLHGNNLFPDEELPEFRRVVHAYQQQLTEVGHALMRGLGLSLGLDENYFDRLYTREPTVLFQIMNYPPAEGGGVPGVWAISEHTDYGLLTILKQDNCGGLEVKSRSGEWLEATPIDGTFVCNLGDMLDRMTNGVYRSTPHRVRVPKATCTSRPRLSFPFFFDPSFHADVKPIVSCPESESGDDKEERWDGASVRLFQGSYGDYLLMKVGRVFPKLKEQVGLY